MHEANFCINVGTIKFQSGIKKESSSTNKMERMIIFKKKQKTWESDDFTITRMWLLVEFDHNITWFIRPSPETLFVALILPQF